MWKKVYQAVKTVLSSPEGRQLLYTGIETVIRIFTKDNGPSKPTLPPKDPPIC